MLFQPSGAAATGAGGGGARLPTDGSRLTPDSIRAAIRNSRTWRPRSVGLPRRYGAEMNIG